MLCVRLDSHVFMYVLCPIMGETVHYCLEHCADRQRARQTNAAKGAVNRCFNRRREAIAANGRIGEDVNIQSGKELPASGKVLPVSGKMLPS